MNLRLPLPLTHTRAPRVVARKTALLLVLLALEVGFFGGAIAFGEALLRLHRDNYSQFSNAEGAEGAKQTPSLRQPLRSPRFNSF